MSTKPRRNQTVWKSPWVFVLAAAGSAVGLGNIWKFPYMAGENGGGAFVLVYLFCIFLLGIPVMITETLLGRRGRSNPVATMKVLARDAGHTEKWSWFGWVGVACGFAILSYYSVIAGWGLAYIVKLLAGDFVGVTGEGSGAIFSALTQKPLTLLGLHTLFMLMTMLVVVKGVRDGLGRAVTILMPVLFVLLVIMVGYAAFSGDIMSGLRYLFVPDFGALTGDGLMEALGHSFFTLSIGMGAILVYGSYMPSSASIGKTVLVIAGLDTLVAILSGLAIFPIVFAAGVEPASGPSLLFISLPIAFGEMPGGIYFGGLFFILVSVAALSSAISLIEPAVAWLCQTRGVSRLKSGILMGALCWVIGIGTVLSFNIWDSALLFGTFTFFDFLDFLTSSVLLPLGGILMAIFAGHVMTKASVRDELSSMSDTTFSLWYALTRWFCPLAIALIFVLGILKMLGVA